MDRLSEMFQEQAKFNSIFITGKTKKDRVQYVKEMLLHLVAEIDEILNAVGNWKHHRKFSGVGADKYTITEEIVDAFKYLLNVALTMNITPDEFYEAFMNKTKVVWYRYYLERFAEQHKDKEVGIVDIDGVLNDYPQTMLDYIKQETGIEFDTLAEAKLALDDYSDIKERYYRDIEMSMPISTEAAEVIEHLARKHVLVIFTTRPRKRFAEIERRTIEQLEAADIHYTLLHFTEDKARDIKMFKKVKLVIEDDPVTAVKIAEEGIKVYWIKRNEKINISHPLIIQIEDLKEVLEHEG